MDYSVFTAWATIVAALAAIIAVLIAAYAIWIEGKRTRFSQGLDVLLRLTDEFNSELYREKRRTVAKILLKKIDGHITINDTENLVNMGEDILDHFQEVGLLLRMKILNVKLVYSDYYYWLSRYWECLKDIFAKSREADPFIWEDAEWLYKKIIGQEKGLLSKRVVTKLTASEIKDFLGYESTLK